MQDTSPKIVIFNQRITFKSFLRLAYKAEIIKSISNVLCAEKLCGYKLGHYNIIMHVYWCDVYRPQNTYTQRV